MLLKVELILGSEEEIYYYQTNAIKGILAGHR